MNNTYSFSKEVAVASIKGHDKDLYPVTTANWKSSNTRVLIVLEACDAIDIKASRLMTPELGKGKDRKVNTTYNSLMGIVKYALTNEGNQGLTNSLALAVVVYNQVSFQEVLSTLKPSSVFVASLKATQSLFPNRPYERFTLGNPFVHNDITYTCSLPLNQLIKNKIDSLEGTEDSNSAADLLYFVARNFSYCLRGKNPYSLTNLAPNPKLVDTPKKLRELFEKLANVDNVDIGIDIETANLSSYSNTIYTVQFAFTVDESYVLPLRHPNTCFSEEQLIKIENKLTKFFGATDDLKNLIFFNGKFDLRILRAIFKLPLINHNIWEVTAGEHNLDENLSLFHKKSFDGLNKEKIKLRFGNLRNMLCHYGNTSYYTLPFSKEQRHTIGHVDICNNKDALDYCGLDAQANLALYQMQLKRAKVKKVYVRDNLESYQPYYVSHVVNQMGITSKALSTMEEYGSHLDVPYLKHLMDKRTSPLVKLIKDLRSELLEFESVRKAAAKISSTSGVKATSLFGASLNATVFEIKPAHLSVLFFDILKLQPISFTETGKPSVDKDFLAAYKDTVPEAGVLSEYSEARKLLSTYVGSWYESVTSNLDGALDNCLRPSFGFFDVVTGRLSSFDPNLQNVPARGKLAKLIKRMFTAPKGHLLPRWDFSAHEVRMWGNVAKDKAVAEGFNVGYRLRKQLVLTPTDEVRSDLKKRGDVHIANVKRFFNKWIEKSDPLRDAIKAVIFGVIYGKSAKTLGVDLQNQKLKELAGKIKAVKAKIADATKGN